MYRERLTVHKNISFTETMSDEIQTLADNIGCSFADIVRACVEADLIRMKDRERKRKARRQKKQHSL